MTYPDKLVDTVARAMSDRGPNGFWLNWDNASQSHILTYRDMAIAALDAACVTELVNALEPFAVAANQLETRSPRGHDGTWVGTEMDGFRSEITVPADLDDDISVLSIMIEFPGGQSALHLTMSMFRTARDSIQKWKS